MLLTPLMRIMIDEEAEKYITSSAIVPRLLHEKNEIETMFAAARQEGQTIFLKAERVQRWQLTLDKLYDAYVLPFTADEEFLAATMLDRRWGTESLPPGSLRAAGAALRARLEAHHDVLELARVRAVQEEEHRRAALPDNAAGSAVREAQARVQQHAHDAAELARALGVPRDEQREGPVLPPATFREVNDEIAVLLRLPKLKMNANAMVYYKLDAPQKLDLARRVARELLSLPAGEAAPERDFSVALRLLGLSRHSLTPEKLGELVFIKKNKVVLGLKL